MFYLYLLLFFDANWESPNVCKWQLTVECLINKRKRCCEALFQHTWWVVCLCVKDLSVCPKCFHFYHRYRYLWRCKLGEVYIYRKQTQDCCVQNTFFLLFYWKIFVDTGVVCPTNDKRCHTIFWHNPVTCPMLGSQIKSTFFTNQIFPSGLQSFIIQLQCLCLESVEV